jgi:hypothetical protein
MSPARTLYVRDEDTYTWAQAEAAAKSRSESLSQYVTHALRDQWQRRIEEDEAFVQLLDRVAAETKTLTASNDAMEDRIRSLGEEIAEVRREIKR